MKIDLKPHTAKTQGYNEEYCESWWYENRNSIDVYIQVEGREVYSCRINRNKLKKWIENTEKN